MCCQASPPDSNLIFMLSCPDHSGCGFILNILNIPVKALYVLTLKIMVHKARHSRNPEKSGASGIVLYIETDSGQAPGMTNLYFYNLECQ